MPPAPRTGPPYSQPQRSRPPASETFLPLPRPAGNGRYAAPAHRVPSRGAHLHPCRPANDADRGRAVRLKRALKNQQSICLPHHMACVTIRTSLHIHLLVSFSYQTSKHMNCLRCFPHQPIADQRQHLLFIAMRTHRYPDARKRLNLWQDVRKR